MAVITTLADDRVRTLRDLLQKNEKRMAMIAGQQFDVGRLMAIGVNAFQRNPKLLQCDVATVARSIWQAAELRMDLTPILGEFYLVPFHNTTRQCYECVGIVGYQGLVQLWYRSGLIENINADIVWREDYLDMQQGTNPYLVHKPARNIVRPARFLWDVNDKGTRTTPEDGCGFDFMEGFYAAAKLSTGGQFVFMDRLEMEAARARSRAADSGPYQTDYNGWMGKKIPMRQLHKTMPRAVEFPELAKATALDVAYDTGDLSILHGIFQAEESVAGIPDQAAQPAVAQQSPTERIKAKVAATSKSFKPPEDYLTLLYLTPRDQAHLNLLCKTANLNKLDIAAEAQMAGVNNVENLFKFVGEYVTAHGGKKAA